MTQRDRNFLKGIGLAISFFGLLASLGNNLGFFGHADRLAMVQMIRSAGRIPSDAEGFAEMVRAFPPPRETAIPEIVSLEPSTQLSSGGYVTPVGPLVYFNSQRQHTAAILTFEELEAWASTTRYRWVAWSVLVIGWLLATVGFAGDLSNSRGNGRAHAA